MALEQWQGEDIYKRLLMGRALFLNQENELAIIEVQKLKEMLQSQEVKDHHSISELLDISHQLEILARKIQLELTNSHRVGSINDAAYLTEKKPVASPQQVKPV